MKIDKIVTEQFQSAVWDYYRDHARADLPWRQPDPDGRFDPYKIMVSELMLQQTQVPRVIPKYTVFLGQFPSVGILAKAEQGDVLQAWSGLGYYRRAKFLHQAAQTIMTDFHGALPQEQHTLLKLPGIGNNTASAISVYAFNRAAVFVETNIRTVMVHHFFYDQHEVSDKEIGQLVSDTLDHRHPREWYWALMDYGSFLKQSVGNLNRQTKSYTKQSTFVGSKRQLRGQIIRMLSDQPLTSSELQRRLANARTVAVIDDLLSEGLIQSKAGVLRL